MSGGPKHPLPLFDELKGFTKDLAKNIGFNASFPTIATIFVAELIITLLIAPELTLRSFGLIVFLSPLWLIPLLMGTSSYLSLALRRYAYHREQSPVLLELRIPRDTMKSPLAMESVFTNLALTPGESTWWKKKIRGTTRPWFSLEIMSDGGAVHFYVWTWASHRRAVESYIYAQYPNVELVEAVDYSRLADPSHDPERMWTAEYKYDAPDPFPIKSYIDFGLDKNPKPEEQVDPLSQVLEVMSSLRKGEQIWLQFMIRAHHKTNSDQYKGRRNAKGEQYTIVDHGKELIESIRTETERTTVTKTPEGISERTAFANPTRGQTEAIAEVEKTIYKTSYDVGIRGIYFGEGDAYLGTTGVYMGSLFKPFNGSNKVVSTGGIESLAGYPWEDIGQKRLHHILHEAVEMYRRRAYFYYPYVGSPMIMSVEELATIFHIPSSTSASSGVPRIPSATSGAPSNLPT